MADQEDQKEIEERQQNQAKADELAEQARQERLAEEKAEAADASKPSRRKSALGDNVLGELSAGLKLGAAEELAADEESYHTSTKASNNVNDILAQDADDESLRKYKESLLGAAATGDLGDASDPRKLVVTEFRVIFEDASAPDVVFDLSSEDGLAKLTSSGYSIKEGSNYKLQLSFRVNHELLSGLKFVNRVKKGVFGQSDELMIGSYAPASQPHVFTFPRYGYNECPKGMMYRGKYNVTDSFVDSDGVTHLTYTYKMNVGKTW